MNKILKLFFSLLCTVGLSIHQVQAQKPVFNYGIKAGFNQPFFKTGFSSSTEYTSNDNFFYAGITTNLRFNKRFSLETEAFWHKDAVVYYNTTIQTVYTEELNYISVPVLAKIHFGKISLYGGPQVSFLTKVNLPIAANRDDPNGPFVHDLDVTDSSYKKTRFCAVIGVEWVFKYRFGIDVRYMAGLGNIAKPGGVTALTYGSDPDVKLSNLQAGLFFRFGKKLKGL